MEEQRQGLGQLLAEPDAEGESDEAPREAGVGIIAQ